MKIQDIVPLFLVAVLLWKRNPYYLVAAGLGFLIIALPLFASWVFFTAQHLSYYAGFCFLLAIIVFSVMFKIKK